MGSIIAIQGQTISVDLREDYRDNGWTISSNKATHNGCNAGYMDLIPASLTIGVPNEIIYEISDYSSGFVNVSVGIVNGTPRTGNGVIREVFTPQEGDKVRFYSDGNLTISSFTVAPVEQDIYANARTYAYDDKNQRWLGNFSFVPENMVRFLNTFFTFRDGKLWKHNDNEIRNNFYGQQYTSKIIFYVNLSPDEVKNFFSMRQKSNKLWTSPNNDDIFIPPSEGKEIGQSSRLKASRFKKLNNGDWFADFLRDINDTRFVNKNDALFNGALLQGNVMRITLENSDTVEVRLLEVDITVGAQNYTY